MEIALFNNWFNPPGIHHLRQIETLKKIFDLVVIAPNGASPTYPLGGDIPSYHRAALIDLAFGHIKDLVIDLSAIEEGILEEPEALLARYAEQGEPWLVVYSEMIKGGKNGHSPIQSQWLNGHKLWENAHFAVVIEEDQEIDNADLPPNSRLIKVNCTGNSLKLRKRLYNDDPVDGRLEEKCAAYIERHHLYRGIPPQMHYMAEITSEKPLIVFDPKNERACALAATFPKSEEKSPDLIIAIGGDGTMLHAIRQHWRKRAPFYGINTGHLGFLLNEIPFVPGEKRRLLVEHLPLLRVEVEGADGHKSALAFNDAWVERASGQTAHLAVSIDGHSRLENLVADGVLVATAAGSTSYARAMGAAPIPLASGAQLLVGSNVLSPSFFRPVVLPLSSQVFIKALDAHRRPLQGFIDGISYGIVESMTTRLSNIASVELLFDPTCDAAEKLARIQFPH